MNMIQYFKANATDAQAENRFDGIRICGCDGSFGVAIPKGSKLTNLYIRKVDSAT